MISTGSGFGDRVQVWPTPRARVILLLLWGSGLFPRIFGTPGITIGLRLGGNVKIGCFCELRALDTNNGSP